MNETCAHEKKTPFALVGDLANNREALWVTTSEYVRKQYVQNMGWLQMMLSKELALNLHP